MTPGPWWLVLWLPLLATLPADAVQEEEEAVMAGNPGSGRWGGGSLLGVRVTRGRGQSPPPACERPDASRFNSFRTHCRAPAQLALCHQLLSEILFYPSPQISCNPKLEEGKSFRVKPGFCPRLAAVTWVVVHMQNTADAPALNPVQRKQLGAARAL